MESALELDMRMSIQDAYQAKNAASQLAEGDYALALRANSLERSYVPENNTPVVRPRDLRGRPRRIPLTATSTT